MAYKVVTFFKAIHGESGFCIDFDGVWSPLADNAHKVQAAHPECKFPVGVSAKTMATLGWERNYRKVIDELVKFSTLTKNRDYEVCLLGNRGCPPTRTLA
jgi:hypothetical protein